LAPLGAKLLELWGWGECLGPLYFPNIFSTLLCVLRPAVCPGCSRDSTGCHPGIWRHKGGGILDGVEPSLCKHAFLHLPLDLNLVQGQAGPPWPCSQKFQQEIPAELDLPRVRTLSSKCLCKVIVELHLRPYMVTIAGKETPHPSPPRDVLHAAHPSS
jgi:hypothetical protein